MNELLKAYSEFLIAVCGLSKNTVDSYARTVMSYADWLSARGEEFTSASQSDIEDWLKSLFYQGHFKNSSRASKLSALKSFYSWLVHSGVLAGSPAERVPTPKFKPGSAHKFSPEELNLLFSGPDASNVAGIRDRALLMLLYGTGPRAFEATGLNLGQLQFTRETCTVMYFGKGAKERTVKLLKHPTRALFAWYSVRIADGAGSADALFTAIHRDKKRHGQRLSEKALNDILKKYAVKIGMKDIEAFIHKMRSTFASDLYDETKDIMLVAAKLGHNNLDSVKQYVEISETALKKGVIGNGRWKELLKGGGNED